MMNYLMARYGDEDLTKREQMPSAMPEIWDRYDSGETEINDAIDIDLLCASTLSVLNFIKKLGRDVAGRAAKLSELEVVIRQIDSKLNEQLNPIMHHPRFQQVESSWRALHRLVHSVTGEIVRIYVFDVELRELRQTPEVVRRSALKRLRWSLPFSKEMSTWGGHPFVLLLSSHLVGAQPDDMRVLDALASAIAHSNGLLVAGAGPELFDMEDFAEFDHVLDINAKINRPEIDNFRRFRSGANARHTVIALPGYVGRPPYASNSSEAFAYTESVDRNANLLWCNPAFALAESLAHAFDRHPYCGERIRGPGGGGELKELAAPVDFDVFQVPGAAGLSDSQCLQLSRLGFSPLRLALRQSSAAFAMLRTVREYEEENGKSEPVAALEHRLVLARLSHHVVHEFRNRYGTFGSVEDAERTLNQEFSDDVVRRRRECQTSLLQSVRIGIELLEESVTLHIQAEVAPVAMTRSTQVLHDRVSIALPH
jgi:type VI secretion system protein ImpC